MPVPGYQALPKLAALLTTGAGARAPADPVGAACRRRMVGTVRLTGQPELGFAVSQCRSEIRPRSAQHGNRPNHQQPEWKHPQARNRLQSQSRQE